MAADEMQVRLTAKDDLTKELKNATKQIAKLEAQLKDLDGATGQDAERDIRKLTTQLDRAYDRAKVASGAVSKLDEDLDQLGYSAKRAGTNMSKLDDDMGRGQSSMVAFGGAMKKGALAATAVAAAAVGMGMAIKKAAELTWQAANQAALYEKKVRRTDIVFGKYAGKVRRWADESNELWGKSVEDVAAYAASVGDILKPLGFTTKESTKLTLSVGELIPALTEWNTVGMDSESVTLALTNALTGEREMLKSLGIVIMEEDVKAKVKAMEAAGKFTTETEKQKKAIATLKLATEGSADALRSYATNSDSVGRTMNKVRAAVADLRDAGLQILASAIRDVSNALRGDGKGSGSLVQDQLDWLMNNRKDLEKGLLSLAGYTLKFASALMRIAQGATYAYGVLAVKLGGMIKVLGILIPGLSEFGDQMITAGQDAIDASSDIGRAADEANRLGEKALGAASDVDALQSSLQTLKDQGASYDVQVRSRNTPVGGDTSVAMGTGSLGAAGLAAAHAGYSSALGGHSILSGVRGSNLGSAQSDHRHGRAMDIRGPRLGAYAQVVRRSGGYAALHGSGANRHLHVVPQTRRPAPQMAGGNTFHADVTVVNPSGEMDIQGAVARGLRQAARQTKERG